MKKLVFVVLMALTLAGCGSGRVKLRAMPADIGKLAANEGGVIGSVVTSDQSNWHVFVLGPYKATG